MTSSSLVEAVRAFIESLPAERGYSVHTCRAYTRDLEEFVAYLSENGLRPGAVSGPESFFGPLDVTAVAIRGYLGVLHQKNQKSSIARKLSTLRSFFKFLVKKGVVDSSPVEGILTPKREKTLPGYLPVDAVFHLLDSIETDSVLAARNRAIFETLYSCGIRVSELAGLNVHDIDPDRGTLKVLGKGAKERIVPVGRKALDAIARYREALQAEKGIGAGANKPLFLNYQGQRLTPRSVARILKKLVTACGIITPVSPHTLRHTFAVSYLRAGGDVFSLQRILGHSDLTMTRRYCELSEADVVERHRLHSPADAISRQRPASGRKRLA